MTSWEMPTKDDFALIGAFIVLYSYIDFNLKRLVEALEYIGKTEKLKGKGIRSTADIARTVQSADWSPENLGALKQIEEFRRTRNLLAHCAIRRFPAPDEAFAFLFKSERDYQEFFGREPPYGITMTAAADRNQIVQILHVVEGIEAWLSKATMQFEDEIEAIERHHSR